MAAQSTFLQWLGPVAFRNRMARLALRFGWWRRAAQPPRALDHASPRVCSHRRNFFAWRAFGFAHPARLASQWSPSVDAPAEYGRCLVQLGGCAHRNRLPALLLLAGIHTAGGRLGTHFPRAQRCGHRCQAQADAALGSNRRSSVSDGQQRSKRGPSVREAAVAGRASVPSVRYQHIDSRYYRGVVG